MPVDEGRHDIPCAYDSSCEHLPSSEELNKMLQHTYNNTTMRAQNKSYNLHYHSTSRTEPRRPPVHVYLMGGARTDLADVFANKPRSDQPSTPCTTYQIYVRHTYANPRNKSNTNRQTTTSGRVLYQVCTPYVLYTQTARRRVRGESEVSGQTN